jgi:hypothetical protein
MEKEAGGIPDERVRECARRFEELRDHLRAEIAVAGEPRMQAMFETAAEVLTGLGKAFHDYREHRESAFKIECTYRHLRRNDGRGASTGRRAIGNKVIFPVSLLTNELAIEALFRQPRGRHTEPRSMSSPSTLM